MEIYVDLSEAFVDGAFLELQIFYIVTITAMEESCQYTETKETYNNS